MTLHVEGYVVPIHRSLTEVILMAGIPRAACFLIWTIGGAFGFGLRQTWVFLFSILLHLILAAATKKDPYCFSILLLAIKNTKRLEP